MRRRKRYGLIMAPLIIAVIGLSIGFAAFSNTLTITSAAQVNPNSSDFRIVFANNTNVNNLDTSSPVEPVDDNVLGVNATINNTGSPTLTGLRANFTAPNQSVSYKVYVVNTGKYTAYLTNLNFNPIIGESFKYCSGSQVTAGLRAAACSDINVSVMIGGTNGVGGTTYTSGSNEISNVSLEPNASMEVYVTISYANNNHYVDGPMTILFGDIILQYRTLDTPTPIIVEEDEEPEIPEFIINDQGVIEGYAGDGGVLTIPSSLPYYVEVGEMFYMDRCVEIFTEWYGAAQAQSTCNSYKEDYEENGSNAEDYGDLTGGYIIAPKYILSGLYVTVTGIDDDAFNDASLTSVVLPNTLETIGNQAFMYNELTSITIPNSVTSIGNSAFLFNNLTSVTIGSGIREIGHSAFADNEDIEEEYGPNALESVSIGVACDTYKTSFTNQSQFGWAAGYTDDDIVWGTACSS